MVKLQCGGWLTGTKNDRHLVVSRLDEATLHRWTCCPSWVLRKKDKAVLLEDDEVEDAQTSSGASQ